MTSSSAPCPLCETPTSPPLWHDARCLVVLAGDPQYPGFCRVVWKQHVSEMTDLPEPDRAHLMQVVFRVECALRELLEPTKINLASLGNHVPHLHWHVVPRFSDDAHFPDSVWARQHRQGRLRIVDPRRLGESLTEKLGPAIATSRA